jgi:hypothetical protein
VGAEEMGWQAGQGADSVPEVHSEVNIVSEPTVSLYLGVELVQRQRVQRVSGSKSRESLAQSPESDGFTLRSLIQRLYGLSVTWSLELPQSKESLCPGLLSV